jgi:hypothetical protein
MAGKGEDRTSRALKEAAGLVAAVAARRGLQLTWKHITGGQPPLAPDDEQVPLGRAVLWAFLVGAAMTIARMFAIRYASHLLPSAERASAENH